MRKWVVKVRVPGPGGETTSSESYLVEADTPGDACNVVNEHLADGDMVGGDLIDPVGVRETTLNSLIPYKRPTKK